MILSLSRGIDALKMERILADALVDVATELRLADPAEFVLMIGGEQAANLADLVNSSSELFYKSGALRYALASACHLHWDSTPTVRIDMEFRHREVTAFLRLTIGGARAGVEILDMHFDDDAILGMSMCERLSAAIADARLR